MDARISLGLIALLGGCAVFEAIVEGLGALVEENADRPRIAYALDDLDNPQVRIGTITEDDLGLPLRTINYSFAAAEFDSFRFSDSQDRLAVSLIEYFSDGQDSGVSLIETETGVKLAFQTDNTVATYVKENCGAALDAQAQVRFDDFTVDFPFPDGSDAAPYWGIEDLASNHISAIGWASETELVVSYGLTVTFGYSLAGSFPSDTFGSEETTGNVLWSQNAAGTWALSACNPASPPLAPETRELRVGNPVGITLDGVSLQSVLNPDTPFVPQKVRSVSRWIY